MNKLLQKYPPLTPLTAPWMQHVVRDEALLSNLFEQYGSPINLHNLGPFADNVKAYHRKLNEYNLEHQIFFARKANVCRAFAREASRLGFGVDTASYRELKECLELGCAPENLVLTAAVKSERLVRLALEHEVLIILDNEDECGLVNRVAGEIGKRPGVGIRISGFNYKGEKLYSRFGFDAEGVTEFITRRLGADRKFNNLHFGGFHFHLDGYSIGQRGAALVQTVQLADALRKQGISTSFIDMGGGLLTRYLSDQSEWETFWNELKKALRGARAPITFGNDGLGYQMIDGELRGGPGVYPFYNETPKEQFLNGVLSHENGRGMSVASLLRDREIELRMEPGRSLLDQSGMTLARVAHRKKDARGNWLVGLQMNRSQLFSASADFLLDPLYISMNDADANRHPVAVYFTGGYCLEGDLILKRKIVLPQLPEIGDVMAFPNTAGYLMHFYETRSHLFEFSTNLIGGLGSPLGFVPDRSYSSDDQNHQIKG